MMLEYNISAAVQDGGKAKAIANQSEISFDVTSGRDTILPNQCVVLKSRTLHSQTVMCKFMNHVKC